MSDEGGRVIPLFPDDDGGATLAQWADRLRGYLSERAVIEPARHQPMPEPPWPARSNPMLGYLVDRATEYMDVHGAEATLVWLAAHAWFEGALEDRFQTVRHLTH